MEQIGLSTYLKARRKTSKLSVEEAAKIIGVSAEEYSNYEMEDLTVEPDVEVIVKILEFVKLGESSKSRMFGIFNDDQMRTIKRAHKTYPLFLDVANAIAVNEEFRDKLTDLYNEYLDDIPF